MSTETPVCPHCGAKMKEYKHNFNKHLAKGLILLYRLGGVAYLRELDLTKAQNNNFQKLKYWGLIEKHDKSDVAWYLTELGKKFIENQVTISKRVVTYRNKTIDFDGEQITLEEALAEHGYWWREQYASAAQTHKQNTRRTLPSLEV